MEFETKTEAVEAEREVETDPDEGITGVVAKWKDVAAKKKKAGQEHGRRHRQAQDAGASLQEQAAAKRAAQHAWKHIEEVREIIRENSEEPWKADESKQAVQK